MTIKYYNKKQSHQNNQAIGKLSCHFFKYFLLLLLLLCTVKNLYLCRQIVPSLRACKDIKKTKQPTKTTTITTTTTTTIITTTTTTTTINNNNNNQQQQQQTNKQTRKTSLSCCGWNESVRTRLNITI